MKLIVQNSELFNKDMSMVPLSKVDQKPLPFSSETNKLNLFGAINQMYGSPAELLSNMVKKSVSDKKNMSSKSKNTHSLIVEKRREIEDKRYMGLYKKNTFAEQV